MKLRRLFKWMFRLGLILLLMVAAANLWVLQSTSKWIHESAADVPRNAVGLVLGTGKRVADGRLNLYFIYRVRAAAALYHAGKVGHLLLSGDNGTHGYNEPADMRDELVRQGVPPGAMTLDFAGFRTLDSIVRARDVFGVQRMIVISDDFHLPRALFLARHFGMQAEGFPSQKMSWSGSWTTRGREALARVKMLLDLYILRTEPKFRGEKIILPVNAGA